MPRTIPDPPHPSQQITEPASGRPTHQWWEWFHTFTASVLARIEELEGVSPDAPTIALSTPDHGSIEGGTSITIDGTGFTGASDVTFDGVDADFSVVSDTEITATSPAHDEGPVLLAITTGSGVAGALYIYDEIPEDVRPHHTKPTISDPLIVLTDLGVNQIATGVAVKSFRFADGTLANQGWWSGNKGVTWVNSPIGGRIDPTPFGGGTIASYMGFNEILEMSASVSSGSNPRTGSAVRSTNDWGTVSGEAPTQDSPRSVTWYGDNGVGSPFYGLYFHHGALWRQSDGQFMVTAYGAYEKDTQLADGLPSLHQNVKLRLVRLLSDDRGASFGDPVTIAAREMITFSPNVTADEEEGPALTQHGFTEGWLIRAKNDDVIAFSTTGIAKHDPPAAVPQLPIYSSRSRNDGDSFEAARAVMFSEKDPFFSSSPYAVVLGNGIIVLVGCLPGGGFALSADHGWSWWNKTTLTNGDGDLKVEKSDYNEFVVIYESSSLNKTVAHRFRAQLPAAAGVAAVEIEAIPPTVKSGQTAVLQLWGYNVNNSDIDGGIYSHTLTSVPTAQTTGVLTATTVYTLRGEIVGAPGTYTSATVTVTVIP